jgi:hypothetical protein
MSHSHRACACVQCAASTQSTTKLPYVKRHLSLTSSSHSTQTRVKKTQTTSKMCQQNNKRIKDLLLLAGGDVAASNDNNNQAPIGPLEELEKKGEATLRTLNCRAFDRTLFLIPHNESSHQRGTYFSSHRCLFAARSCPYLVKCLPLNSQCL